MIDRAVLSAVPQSSAPMSGDQRSGTSPGGSVVSPSGQYAHTRPYGARASAVARTTSGFVEVETTGPNIEMIAGVITAAVFPAWLRGGPRISAWPCRCVVIQPVSVPPRCIICMPIEGNANFCPHISSAGDSARLISSNGWGGASARGTTGAGGRSPGPIAFLMIQPVRPMSTSPGRAAAGDGTRARATRRAVLEGFVAAAALR